jgi:hypothetical protein
MLTADIILNGGKLKLFLLKSGTNKTRVFTSPILIQYNLEIPSQSKNTGRRIKWIQIGKEGVK